MMRTFFRKRGYLFIILLLFFVMGIGYALINTNLKVNNNIYITGYKSKKIYDYMKVNSFPDNTSSTYVTSSSGISFSAVGSATNGRGIYMVGSTASDDYPIYYYRGSISNNNVKFANFCWKIVRTTNTGGIKLIYNGVPLSDGSCNNTGDSSQIGVSAFNTFTNPSIADIGFMYGERYETGQTSMTGKKYAYGNDVTYSNGTYTLVDAKTPSTSYLLSLTTLKNGLHYTCMSTATSCSTVYYVYNFATSYTHHATLTGGLLLNQYLNNSTSGSTNTTSSTIKNYLDSWYSSNMVSYASYLEDTVWCNDRSIYDYNGWDKDTNSTADMHFNGYARNFLTYKPSVVCNNDSDKFSVSSSVGNGKLTYPVGLITADEIIMASGGTSDYIHTGNSFWTMTPSYYGDTSSGAHNYVFGTILESVSKISAEYGVRPMVSLKPGIEYSSGDGSYESPFVIE